MKNRILSFSLLLCSALPVSGQVGIGTTSPNSTLDVRGALALNFRTFTATTTIGDTDNTLVFTGTTAATASLPDASNCPGRIYHIKNASTANPVAALTVLAAAAQQIDGNDSLLLNNSNEAVTLVSNGNGWYISGRTGVSAEGNSWLTGGNAFETEKTLGTQTATDLPFITQNTERMRLTATGRLGIGTTTPFTDAHIVGGNTTTGLQYSYIRGLTITGTGSYGFGGPGFYLENTDNPAGKRLFKINYTANGGTEGYINFQAVSDNGGANVNANILAIAHSGRVGIGSALFNTTNPEKLLVDAGASNSQNLISGRATSDRQIQFNLQNNSSGAAASSAFAAFADNGNDNTNAVKLGINGSSNLGTGITGGANRVYLVGSGADFAIGNTSTGKDLVFFTGGSSNSNERLRISATAVLPGGDNLYTLGANGNRWAAVWAADGIIQTSDARLKENIHPLPYGLSTVLKLQPVAYSWIGRPGSAKLGLLAQDVKQLIPEVVSGNESQEALGMNYAELVPVLINAIKELKAEVDALKKKIDACPPTSLPAAKSPGAPEGGY